VRVSIGFGRLVKEPVGRAIPIRIPAHRLRFARWQLPQHVLQDAAVGVAQIPSGASMHSPFRVVPAASIPTRRNPRRVGQRHGVTHERKRQRENRWACPPQQQRAGGPSLMISVSNQPPTQGFPTPALRKEREGRGAPCVADAREIKTWDTRPTLPERGVTR
jgi:hypothetical protein